MDRVKKVSSRVFKSRKIRKMLLILFIFSLGALSGVIGSKVLLQDEPKGSQESLQSTSTLSAEERARRNSERIDDAYTRAQERVKRDVQEKRLDQKKADQINKKLEEIYTYRKSLTDQPLSDEKRQELQDKRKEWREWLEQNSISSRYFIGVI